MEAIFIISIIIIIIYFVAKNKQKKQLKQTLGQVSMNSKSNNLKNNPIKIEFQTTSNKTENYFDEENYEETWFFNKNDELEDIFQSEDPLHYALTTDMNIYNFINDKNKVLADKYKSLKNEDILYAVKQMIGQVRLKKMVDLPEYLTKVPIKSLIGDGIFINPGKDSFNEIFDTYTMAELKEMCMKYNIKPARSKKETIELLIKSEAIDNLNLDLYFRVNPAFEEMIDQCKDYFMNKIDAELSKNNKIFFNISKPLNPSELKEKIEKGKYSLQSYGYHYVIYFIDEKPIFKVPNWMHRSQMRALLLDDGLLCITQEMELGPAKMKQVFIVNNKKEVVKKFDIKDINMFESVFELEQKPFIAQKMDGNNFWILKYDTMEERYIKNPNKLDVYTLVEENF